MAVGTADREAETAVGTADREAETAVGTADSCLTNREICANNAIEN